MIANVFNDVFRVLSIREQLFVVPGGGGEFETWRTFRKYFSLRQDNKGYFCDVNYTTLGSFARGESRRCCGCWKQVKIPS